MTGAGGFDVGCGIGMPSTPGATRTGATPESEPTVLGAVGGLFTLIPTREGDGRSGATPASGDVGGGVGGTLISLGGDGGCTTTGRLSV